MSKIDERPVFKFKRDYDIKKRREWVTVEGIVRQNNRDQVRKLRLAVDDGVVRGRVEGFVALKPGYDRVATKLEWDDDEYYDNMNQCLIGTSEMAWERVRDGAFFSAAVNRTEANRLRFWQEITKDLSGNQTDCRGIVIEHMKREVAQDNPDDNLARFRDIMKMLAVLPGTTNMPNPGEQLVLFFEIHPKGWREKFKAVPRDIADGVEDLVSVTRYMRMCYDSEQKSGKRVSDGAVIKRAGADATPNKETDKNKNKKHKNKNGSNQSPKTTTKADDGICRRKGCANAPRHRWENCYYNRNSTNYRPDMDQGGRGSGGGRGGRGGRGGGGHQGRGRGGRGYGGGGYNNQGPPQGQGGGQGGGQYYASGPPVNNYQGSYSYHPQGPPQGQGGGGVQFYQGGTDQHHFDAGPNEGPNQVMNGREESRRGDIRPGGDCIPREVILYGQQGSAAYGNFRPRN